MIATGAPVQVRDVAAMRAAVVLYSGPREELGACFDRLARWVQERDLFAAGPHIASYRDLPDVVPTAVLPDVHAELMIPLTRLPESEGDVRCVRVPTVRAACVMYDGAMDAGFRAAHDGLFAWIDAQGLVRDGTRHQHAYIRTGRGLGHWTVEIRVPLVGKTA